MFIGLHDAVVNLPSMVEDVPGYPADEIPRWPEGPAARASLR
jgi:hypothetical protein